MLTLRQGKDSSFGCFLDTRLAFLNLFLSPLALNSHIRPSINLRQCGEAISSGLPTLPAGCSLSPRYDYASLAWVL
jgi:hypothetical protein